MQRLLMLLLLILPNRFYAQTIDAINSNEQAMAFLKKVKPGFKEDTLDAERRHTVDSLWPFLKRYNYYEKADFDNNGYTDLLFNGCSGGHYSSNDSRFSSPLTVFPPLVILSYGNDSFRIKDLYCIKYVNYALAKTLQSGGLRRIKIASDGYEGVLNKWPRRINKADTLVYAFDEFIENTRPAHHTIERISFTNLGFGSVLDDSLSFELTISRDSTWLTRQIHKCGDWSLKKYVTHTDTTTWNRLTGLLNYMNFPGLKKYYSTGKRHESFGYLSVTYDKKKICQIKDEGLFGTYGLSAIYDIFINSANLFEGRLVSNEGGMVGPPGSSLCNACRTIGVSLRLQTYSIGVSELLSPEKDHIYKSDHCKHLHAGK